MRYGSVHPEIHQTTELTYNLLACLLAEKFVYFQARVQIFFVFDVAEISSKTVFQRQLFWTLS